MSWNPGPLAAPFSGLSLVFWLIHTLDLMIQLFLHTGPLPVWTAPSLSSGLFLNQVYISPGRLVGTWSLWQAETTQPETLTPTFGAVWNGSFLPLCHGSWWAMLSSHAGRQLQVSTLETFNSFMSEALLSLDIMGVFMKDPEFVILVFWKVHLTF